MSNFARNISYRLSLLEKITHWQHYGKKCAGWNSFLTGANYVVLTDLRCKQFGRLFCETVHLNCDIDIELRYRYLNCDIDIDTWIAISISNCDIDTWIAISISKLGNGVLRKIEKWQVQLFEIPTSGLPNGIFSYQKSQFGYIMEGPGMETVGIF
jgi:hypothetical protein